MKLHVLSCERSRPHLCGSEAGGEVDEADQQNERSASSHLLTTVSVHRQIFSQDAGLVGTVRQRVDVLGLTTRFLTKMPVLSIQKRTRCSYRHFTTSRDLRTCSGDVMSGSEKKSSSAREFPRSIASPTKQYMPDSYCQPPLVLISRYVCLRTSPAASQEALHCLADVKLRERRVTRRA